MIKKSRNKILSLMILIGLMSLYATQAVDEQTITKQTITINPSNGTIQEAIDNASSGDTILLENGTYTGVGNRGIYVYNKSVTIKAAPGANPIINAEGHGIIFYIIADNVRLDGLTLTGGGGNIPDFSWWGGILNKGANFSVSNTSFINNTSGQTGAGINNYADNCSVGNCSFINNTCHSNASNGAYSTGIGICNFNGANFSVSNTIFINNRADITSVDGIGDAMSTGGGISNFNGANFSVSNASFINNKAFDNGTMYRSSSAGAGIANYADNCSVSNAIFINNSAQYGAGISNGGANFNVSNSSFINNEDNFYAGAYSVGGGILNGGANCSVSGCDIVGNSGGGIYNGGDNSIINYNRIVNNTKYGYGLNTTKGINADFNWWGTNNISNAGIIGVVPNSYFVIQLSANGNYTRNNTAMSGLLAPVTLTYNMVLNNTNSSENNSRLPDFNTAIKLTGSSDELINAKVSWNTTLTNVGEYNFTAICDNENLKILTNVTQAEQTITINPSNSTIQEAINNIAFSGTILLENGTYTGSGNININVNKPVTIKAAPNNNTPIINAKGQGRVFNINADNVLLNGLTITGGNTADGGGIYNTRANFSVSNTIFNNNTAKYGAGIYNTGANFNVNNNSFNNNTADYGDGIYNTGANFNVNNTSFNNNRATNYGGGIYNTGANFIVSNSSFNNNIAIYGGGIYNTGANFIVINTSFDNNTPNHF
jgi:hypothetical protein